MKILLKYIAILNCFALYSQVNIEPGIYITEDNLQYITIVDNDDFGYQTFIGTLPYIYYKKKRNQSFCGTHLFEIDKKGFGKYKLSDNNLILSFEKDENPLDSLNISKVPTNLNSDTTTITFEIRTYSYKELENEFLGVNIKSEDGSFNLDTGFENKKSIKIPKNKFPITFTINGLKDITFEKINEDYLALLYFNSTKMWECKKYEKMSFEFDKLKKIE
ncbi:hypothetical protein ACFSQ0_02590 [Mesonia sediminis]|uniref:Uncharacterized protein n=1 Tax=Mesonia sediminis TaxID=1703946 RepID=A0ABW5SB09_9FLAO